MRYTSTARALTFSGMLVCVLNKTCLAAVVKAVDQLFSIFIASRHQKGGGFSSASRKRGHT